jgi:hypothetical protein
VLDRGVEGRSEVVSFPVCKKAAGARRHGGCIHVRCLLFAQVVHDVFGRVLLFKSSACGFELGCDHLSFAAVDTAAKFELESLILLCKRDRPCRRLTWHFGQRPFFGRQYVFRLLLTFCETSTAWSKSKYDSYAHLLILPLPPG